MSYSNGIQTTHIFDGAALDTDADFVGGETLPNMGPELEGRVAAIAVYITVATTVAACRIEVGEVGGDEDGYAFLDVPVSSIGDIVNGVTDGALGNRIPGAFRIGSDGGATAGDGDVVVVIEWS